MLCCYVLMIVSPFYCYLFIAIMVTSASFHGMVGLQNASRYMIDKKNYWRYDGFIATPEMGDIPLNMFTFSANTASTEDGIYLLDELQPLPDGARAFPTIVIAGKVLRGAFTLQQENSFDMDVSQYVAGPQQNMRVHCYYLKGHPRFSKTPLPTASKHIVIQGTVRSVTGDRCMVPSKISL
ncbi:hypothetical protein DFJ58DRAFT_751643 [Suillus subalutaceus]|uniref:uncharacterized protein n=1 Tax=Suillus subalutaceus TaxID=48586 RepID=UPI001B86EAAA|nr:uncharacterized protein DFJ58DRAFT_751643 [Suillus subalutaceus]KAG1817030.1 hypothetical protein DFJ58DRAFT_751643 [Suillus subalutaceus]